MYVEKDYHLIYVKFAAFYGTYVHTLSVMQARLWLSKLGVDTSIGRA